MRPNHLEDGKVFMSLSEATIRHGAKPRSLFRKTSLGRGVGGGEG